MDQADPARGRILRDQYRRRATDELRGVIENIMPQRRVEKCVVDVADELSQFVITRHLARSKYAGERRPSPAVWSGPDLRYSSRIFRSVILITGETKT